MSDSSHSQSPRDPEFLARYIAGTCSEDDAALMRAAMERDPELARAVEGAIAALDGGAGVLDHNATLDSLDRLRSREEWGSAIRVRQGKRVFPSRSVLGGTSVRRGSRWQGASALLLSAAVIGVGLWTTRSAPSESAKLSRAYRTSFGQRSTVQLRDGSSMTLAPATTVVVTSSGVEVTGEAYFQIAPHSERPFIVRTSDATVRVLGTRFYVRRYADDVGSRVIVEDGRVALRSSRSAKAGGVPTVLTSRMLAMVTDSGVTVSSGIAMQGYTSWTRGLLTFEGVALRDVVAELVHVYGAAIQIADTTLANQKVQIEISITDDPLTQVLGTLCKVTNSHYSARVTREGRSYVLSPGRVATQEPLDAQKRNSIPQPEQQYGL